MPTADPTSITIPAGLKPADGRFGAGPSKVRGEQVAALSEIAPHYLGTSHRQAAVKGQVGRLREGLSALFGLPERYEVVLGNGGSTAFWEVACFGLIDTSAQFLAFGEFGSKFASSAKKAPFIPSVDVREAQPPGAPAASSSCASSLSACASSRWRAAARSTSSSRNRASSSRSIRTRRATPGPISTSTSPSPTMGW